MIVPDCTVVSRGVFEVFDLGISLCGVWVDKQDFAGHRVQDEAQGDGTADTTSTQDSNTRSGGRNLRVHRWRLHLD